MTKYGDDKFKCGEDDDGYPIRVKLKHYLRYMDKQVCAYVSGSVRLLRENCRNILYHTIQYQTDDSPLYLFESAFADRENIKELVNDYEVRNADVAC